MLSEVSHDEPFVPRHVLFLFVSTLLLAMVFPLVPLWGFGLRLAALLMVWHFRGQFVTSFGRVGGLYLTVMLALGAIVSVQIVSRLTSGLGWLMDRVLLIHGLELTEAASIVTATFDAGLVAGIGWIAWKFYQRQGTVERWRRMAIGSATLFAAWGLLSTITTHWTASAEAFAQNLNWQRLWMEWCLCFLLATCVVRAAQMNLLIKSVVAAGALNAAIIIGQHLFSDFSYVLESVQSFDVYFMRSRGNYYYHGAAMQMLLLPLFAVLILNSDGRRNLWLWAAGLLIAAALYLNGTRATALAATTGMGFFLLVYIPWWRVPLRPIAFAVAGLCAFGTMIDYTKPTLGGLAGESQLAHANSGRIGLMISGLQHLGEAPVFGQGAGNISIPVQQPLGDTTTYSSHCLYVDSFLAGGLVTGVSLLLWFVVPTLFLLSDRIFGPSSDRPDHLTAAKVGLFAAFGVSCLFFSIERADTVALFAAMLGVVFPRAARAAVPETESETAAPDLPGQRRFIMAALGLGLVSLPFTLPPVAVFGIVLAVVVVLLSPLMLTKSASILDWLPTRKALRAVTLLLVMAAPVGAVVTSSCYAWPAIEFAWRHHKDVTWQGETRREVYSNSPTMAHITNKVASLLGDRDLQVRILEDDPAQLPKSAKILWNPVNDRDYPNLIKHFGYHITPPSVRAPGFRLPKNWSVIPSKQMTVSFLNVGPLVSPPIRLQDIGHVTVNGEQVKFGSTRQPASTSNRLQYRFTPTHRTQFSGGRIACQFETEPAARLDRLGRFTLQGEVVSANGRRFPLEAEGAVEGGAQQLSFALPTGDIGAIELELIGDESARFRTMSVEAYCNVLPDIAAHAIEVRDESGRDATTLIDDNLTTAHGFWTNAPASFTFDFDSEPTAISLYRFSRTKTIDAAETVPLSWQLLGSDDAKTWKILDSRDNVPIGDEYKNYHSFTVAHPQPYRLYRLLFPAVKGDAPTAISLSEIELLPMLERDSKEKYRTERLAEPETNRGVH